MEERQRQRTLLIYINNLRDSKTVLKERIMGRRREE